MKYLLSSFFLFFFLYSNAVTTYINFEVIAPSQNRDILLYYKKDYNDKLRMYKLTLKHDNKVSAALDIERSILVDVEYGEDRFRMFIRPGDDLSTKFTAYSSLTSLQFSGKGEENNKLLSGYESQFKQGGYQNYEAAYIRASFLDKYYSQSYTKTPSSFFKWMNEEKDKQITYMMKNGNSKEIHSELFDYIRNDIEYTLEAQKLGYLIAKQDKLGPGDFDRIADHYKLRKTAASMSGTILEHPAYLNYLFAYAHFLYLPKIPRSVQVELEYYNRIEKNTSGRAKYFLLSQLLQKVYTYEGSLDLARKKFAAFKNECPYPKYIEEVERLYGEIMIDMPERSAIDFEVIDAEGNRSKLSDYRGRVVYISFWASWCKPCISGFQKSEQLRVKLKKMGVELLNVSIDKTKEAWIPALQQHNPYGTNVIAYNLPKIKQDYGLNAIPAYYIVNKKGKFAYLSNEQNRDLIQEFQDLVNE